MTAYTVFRFPLFGCFKSKIGQDWPKPSLASGADFSSLTGSKLKSSRRLRCLSVQSIFSGTGGFTFSLKSHKCLQSERKTPLGAGSDHKERISSSLLAEFPKITWLKVWISFSCKLLPCIVVSRSVSVSVGGKSRGSLTVRDRIAWDGACFTCWRTKVFWQDPLLALSSIQDILHK